MAGPMTGIPQYNFPAFDRAARELRSLGHDVVSPAELDDPADREAALQSPDGAPQTVEDFGKSWGDFLARDVKLIADDGIEGIVLLSGWNQSRGARLEAFVGSLCGLSFWRFKLNGQPGIVPVDIYEVANGFVASLGEDMYVERW